MWYLFYIIGIVWRNLDGADNCPGTWIAVVHQHTIERWLFDVHFMYDFLLDIGEYGVAPP